MRVHRHPRQRLLLVPHVRVLAAEIASYGGCPPHDTLVSWLIDCGEIESAVTDAICPRYDIPSEVTRIFRAPTRAAADAVAASWLHQPDAVRAALRDLVHALQTILALPRHRAIETILRPISQGYAFTSVTPEQFIHGALTLQRRFTPCRAFIVGLRSIGTSLSAIVASALAMRSVICESVTVRTHGPSPGEHASVDPSLLHRWLSHEDALFIIVGEGPDETGASFAAAIDMLRRAGVDDQRVVVMSSAQLARANGASPHARSLFSRVHNVSASFDEVWLESGRLLGHADHSTSSLREVSSGTWRLDSLTRPDVWPAVQPQHERRKYRFADRRVEGGWLKWIGLGRYGEAHRVRAAQMADWGFAPEPIAYAHGFLTVPHVVGRPLHLDSRPRGIVQAMADYLACIACECRCPPRVSLSRFELADVLRENVEEALGSSWMHATAQLIRTLAIPDGRGVPLIVHPDARMQPHEWIETPSGFVKTDGFEHFDDPFFPGTTDIAWDVSGACMEWQLTPFEEEAFLARYRVRSGDQTIAQRLPFFRAAYAAFRLGYATLAGESLAESAADADAADATRFAALRQRYADALRHELSAVKPVPSSRLNYAAAPFIRTTRVGASYRDTNRDDPDRSQTG